MLFLYLLSQDVNQDYDTYDSFVVASRTEIEARRVHPRLRGEEKKHWEENGYYDWAKPSDVKVTLIGVAGPDINPGDVICASFNAG